VEARLTEWTDAEALRVRVETALGGRSRRVAPASDRVPAAVLILVVYRVGEPHVVFAKKTEMVPHHRGQFSFPGGVVGTLDGSRVETAPGGSKSGSIRRSTFQTPRSPDKRAVRDHASGGLAGRRRCSGRTGGRSSG
jgi:hypothetical protein